MSRMHWKTSLAFPFIGFFLAAVSLLGVEFQQGELRKGTVQETSWYLSDSGRPGPVIMIVGGMHGNEQAGSRAAAQPACRAMPTRTHRGRERAHLVANAAPFPCRELS